MSSKSILAAIGLLALVSTPSYATSFTFSGMFGAADPFFPGQTFSGSFSYDDTAANTATSIQAAYDAVTAFDFAFSGGDSGSLKPASAPASSVQVDDFNPGDSDPDRWAISAFASDLNTTLSNLFFVAIDLRDPTQVAQDGIPASGIPLPNLPLLTDKQFLVQFNDSFTQGTITSISAVPLPATLPLLGTAFGLFGLVGRARKKRTA